MLSKFIEWSRCLDTSIGYGVQHSHKQLVLHAQYICKKQETGEEKLTIWSYIVNNNFIHTYISLVKRRGPGDKVVAVVLKQS